MTGNIGTNEIIDLRSATRDTERGRPAPLHIYGRLAIWNVPEGEPRSGSLPLPETGLDETERLGAAALRLRNSESFRAAKVARANEGRPWGEATDGAEPLACLDEPRGDEKADPRALSGRLAGTVAVGLIVVSGPTPALTITESERLKVAAEVQEALSYLASMAPARDVTFVHHVRPVAVNVAPVASGDLEAFEAPWRDAVLTGLGLPPGRAGCRSYAGQLRQSFGTDWAYVAFFTKYRLGHYAYAIRDHAKVVMSYFNGNRGPNEIDWTFAHESGHIFGAPDEYSTATRPCSCRGDHGLFHLPNRNCDNCAPGGGSRCIMRESTFRMCAVTPYHLGYNGLPPLGVNA
jgi:hypothetical protein